MRMTKTNFDITSAQCIGHGDVVLALSMTKRKNSLNKRETFEYGVCMR